MDRLGLTSSIVLGVAASLATLGQVEAGTRVFDPTIPACNTVNCSSETINGTQGALGGGGSVPLSALPWTLEIFAHQSHCLRVQVTAQDTDLEAVLVAPNGTVFRNDDSGITGCTLCPLVKVGNTPNQGWYTLQISRFNGDGTFANFTVRYGLYRAGNANCTTPTTPQFVAARVRGERLKAEGAESLDAFGEEFDLDAVPPAPNE